MNRALTRLRTRLNSGRAPAPGADFSRPWHRAFLATFVLSWAGSIALALLGPTSRPVTLAASALILLGAVAGITLLARSIASSASGLRAR